MNSSHGTFVFLHHPSIRQEQGASNSRPSSSEGPAAGAFVSWHAAVFAGEQYYFQETVDGICHVIPGSSGAAAVMKKMEDLSCQVTVDGMVNAETVDFTEGEPILIVNFRLSIMEEDGGESTLALADGTVEEDAPGAESEIGEVMFQYEHDRYQEVGPSYKGQIVTMTYPDRLHRVTTRRGVRKPTPGSSKNIWTSETRRRSSRPCVFWRTASNIQGIDTRALPAVFGISAAGVISTRFDPKCVGKGQASEDERS
jgi:hypothetical protein